MTVLKGGRHAWAPAFCVGCESIVHYQVEDVTTAPTLSLDGKRRGIAFVITCKCGHRIEVGAR